MKIKTLTLILTCGLAIALVQCNFNPQETESIKRGVATIAADESLKPIVEAEMQAYIAHYPETSFEIKYMPEQRAVNQLLTDSVQMAIITRELRPKEQQFYKNSGLKYQPAPMALDAVTLIVNKDSGIEKITISELKKLFLNNNTSLKLVFDNSNSSNLNHIKNKIGVENSANANIFSAKGNNEVFDYVVKYKDAIGVIGNNWISDEDNTRMTALKQKIKILSVAENSTSGYYQPTTKNLQARKYPLERLIYLHTTQSDWRVAKGFIRFACSQVGQLVIEKMGLIPYYIIPKVYVIDNTPVRELQKKAEK